MAYFINETLEVRELQRVILKRGQHLQRIWQKKDNGGDFPGDR